MHTFTFRLDTLIFVEKNATAEVYLVIQTHSGPLYLMSSFIEAMVTAIYTRIVCLALWIIAVEYRELFHGS